LQLFNCRITNAVKCLPPQNKPQTDEIKRCNQYLSEELQTLAAGSVLLALGAIAHQAVLLAVGARRSQYVFGHGARHSLPRGLVLIDSYHCSRYNTQTRRLTAPMFERVFADIASLLAERKEP
jgi:uracil-DNA glycosylase family 4